MGRSMDNLQRDGALIFLRHLLKPGGPVQLAAYVHSVIATMPPG
jgi:hypothetical protein